MTKWNVINKYLQVLLIACFFSMLSSCGFGLRGDMPLAKPLHSMHFQSVKPYGTLAQNLRQSLKMSNVTLVPKQADAKTTLTITQDRTSQKLLSVSGTQQTRQYELAVVVSFQISDQKGRVIIDNQILSETRTITVQSNQILGSSNEASLYYDQMRRSLASAIMNRLSSIQMTRVVNQAFPKHSKKHKSSS